MKTISAVEAKRHFYALLRDVDAGEVVTVHSHGKPVATIGSVACESGLRQTARQGLFRRLRENQASGTRNWTRDELYETQGGLIHAHSP